MIGSASLRDSIFIFGTNNGQNTRLKLLIIDRGGMHYTNKRTGGLCVSFNYPSISTTIYQRINGPKVQRTGINLNVPFLSIFHLIFSIALHIKHIIYKLFECSIIPIAIAKYGGNFNSTYM